MRIAIAMVGLWWSVSTFAGNPWCTVRVAVGSASDIPVTSNFFPNGGAEVGSGVQFSMNNYSIDPVPWGGEVSKTLFVPSCFSLTWRGVLYVRAVYVGKIGVGSQAFCYNDQLSRLSASEVFVPTFPGPLWKPCSR